MSPILFLSGSPSVLNTTMFRRSGLVKPCSSSRMRLVFVPRLVDGIDNVSRIVPFCLGWTRTIYNRFCQQCKFASGTRIALCVIGSHRLQLHVRIQLQRHRDEQQSIANGSLLGLRSSRESSLTESLSHRISSRMQPMVFFI